MMIESSKFWFIVLLMQLCLASQISFYIRYLDKKICDGIENPVLRGGKYLYRDLLDLAIHLQSIEQKVKDDKKEGGDEAREIIEEGGVNLPNVTQNDERIMDAFNWTKDQADELREKTKYLSRLWHSIVKGLDKKPSYPVDYDMDSDRFVNSNTTT